MYKYLRTILIESSFENVHFNILVSIFHYCCCFKYLTPSQHYKKNVQEATELLCFVKFRFVRYLLQLKRTSTMYKYNGRGGWTTTK